MSENNKKEADDKKQQIDIPKKEKKGEELTLEQKLKETEDKLLRSLAEVENQRRRFEKEIKDAFEFGSFNFAKESLAILDNLERAKNAIKDDEILKINKDLDKFLDKSVILNLDCSVRNQDDEKFTGNITCKSDKQDAGVGIYIYIWFSKI